ncbi:hypothetical protein HOY80DRAFT_942740 [Tuber brumale]|nr:hypothetical protein HOY80DRAFT_942740 [Tuber brumale]
MRRGVGLLILTATSSNLLHLLLPPHYKWKISNQPIPTLLYSYLLPVLVLPIRYGTVQVRCHPYMGARMGEW